MRSDFVVCSVFVVSQKKSPSNDQLYFKGSVRQFYLYTNVHYVFLPDVVFLPCDHGLDFGISLLCENSIDQSMGVGQPVDPGSSVGTS